MGGISERFGGRGMGTLCMWGSGGGWRMECGICKPVEEEGNHSRDSIQALDTHLNVCIIIALKFQISI